MASSIKQNGDGQEERTIKDFSVVDDSDATKQMQFDLSGLEADTTMSLPVALFQFPSEDPEDGVTIWNDAGVLKVASPAA